MNFKQLRETHGLTMREISRLLGVSENYLWMIESGKRKMSKLLAEKFENIVADITTPNNNIIKSQSTSQQTDLPVYAREYHCKDDPEEVCALCGQRCNGTSAKDDIDIYQPRSIANTVIDNNHKLTEISAGINAISNEIGAIAKLDTIVDNIMITRSRALIDVYNHHIVEQARVMVFSLETIINLIKNNAITLDGAIIMLEDLKRHLNDLRGCDPTDPMHNPSVDTPWALNK